MGDINKQRKDGMHKGMLFAVLPFVCVAAITDGRDSTGTIGVFLTGILNELGKHGFHLGETMFYMLIFGALVGRWTAGERRVVDASLHFAARRGFDRLARILVRLGARVSERDLFEKSPLDRAVLEGHASTARALLDLGADLSDSDERGDTIFHRVAREGNAEACGLLMGLGADPGMPDGSGRTVIDVAQGQTRNVLLGALAEAEAEALMEETCLPVKTSVRKRI